MDLNFDRLDTVVQVLVYLCAFAIVAVASGQIAGVFRKLRLPLITGFLVIGIFAGPEVLGLIDAEALPRLRFLNDIALAFIAFAVGSELYLKELTDRLRSIVVMTVSQVVITFVLVSLAIYLMAGMIPFLYEMEPAARIAVSLLAGTIAVARSPASAIAIINELRARGPFTQTSLGVTVVKDFGVVIIFAVIFTLSRSLIQEADFRIIYIVQAVAELAAAFGLGILVGYVLKWILSIKGASALKKVLVLAVGFTVYLLTRAIGAWSVSHLGLHLHIEPLMIALIGSFMVTNYTVYRNDFVKVVKETGPYVYIVFFTLTGALISLEVLASLWHVTLIIFGARLISLFVAGYIGSSSAGDPIRYRWISWMPYVTQAGVGVGLATVIGVEYGVWGGQFATLMIAVIVLNQLVGPPLFKWALHLVGEVHVRPDGTYEPEKKIIIFGWESQSAALARKLKSQSWQVEFVVADPAPEVLENREFVVHELKGSDHLSLRKFGTETADTLVCLLSDEENYAICETAYEHFGTNHLIVRLNDRSNYAKFNKLGAMVMDPNTAMVSLLEHFVRAPIATTLLLGMEETQDSVDIEVRSSAYHGRTLRDLRLPSDVLVLSVTRGGNPIISHGYTRLRLGDVVTLVGSRESLDQVRLKMQGY